MSNPEAIGYTAEDVRFARCMHMKEMLFPWSIRKLATRTGLTKAAVESIYAGMRDISMSDVEVIAPVLRMSPGELFDELLQVKIDPNSPAPSERTLDYGSVSSREIATLDDYRKARPAEEHEAIITAIGARA